MSGLQSKEAEKERFFSLVSRVTESSDPAGRERLKEELARMTFDADAKDSVDRSSTESASALPASLRHGVAIVPSTLLLPRERVRLAPIVDDNVSLGFWVVVGWDTRRFLPPYGERFIAELVDHTRRAYPGAQFDRTAPPVRPIDEAALRMEGRSPHSPRAAAT